MATVRKRVRRHVHDADDHRLFKRDLAIANRPRARRLGAGREQLPEFGGKARQFDGCSFVTREWSDTSARTSQERPSLRPQARGPSEHIGARLGAPVHQLFALWLSDVLDENDERL